MNKRYFVLPLFALLLLISSMGWGQAGGGGGNQATTALAQLPKIIQAAPEAAALGRYGDQRLGLTTGTPQVKIPLYELKTKTLALPIALSYSSNGIKVDELASRVGMSWVLNAGGVINRTVYDAPDINNVRTPAPPNHNFHPFSDLLFQNENTATKTDDALLSWLEAYSPGPDGLSTTDAQRDEFTFNFNGYAGKFILDNQNQPVLLPQSNLKIEYLPVTTTQNGSTYTASNFKITTPEGTKYYFGGDAVDVTSSSTGYSNHDFYISAWYLNRIESASDPTDYITLTYGNTSYGYSTGVSQTVTVPQPPPTNNPRTYTAIGGATLPGLNLLPKFSKQGIGVNSVYLQRITAAHYGTLRFTYQAKPDVTSGQDYLVQQLALDLPAGQPTVLYTFTYDILAPNGIKNSSSDYYAADFFSLVENLPRPFLRSVVQTTSSASTLTKKYKFDYNNPGDLPPHLAFAQDHWGYYNGKTGLNSLLFPGPNYERLGATVINKLRFNRDVDYAQAQHGLLTKITYPTGGTTTFAYEGNSTDGQSPVLSPESQAQQNPITVVQSINVNSGATPSLTFYVKKATQVQVSWNISCNCPSGGCTTLPDETRAGELIFNNTTTAASFDFRAYNARGDCARSSATTVTLQPGSYGLGSLPHAPYAIGLQLKCVNSADSLFIPASSLPGALFIPPYIPLGNLAYGGLRVRATTDTDPVTGIIKTTTYTYSGRVGSYIPQYELPLYRFGLGALSVGDDTGKYSAYTAPGMPLDYAEYLQFLAGTYGNLVGRDSHSVQYTTVTEQVGNQAENGLIEHHFSYNLNNSSSITPYGGHLVLNASPPEYSWRNGLELSTTIYKQVEGAKTPVQEVVNTYTIDPRINRSFEQFIIKKNAGTIMPNDIAGLAYTLDDPVTSSSVFNPYFGDPILFASDFGHNKRESIYDIYSITHKQEWQYLSSTQTRHYDSNGQNPLTTTEEYYYDNPTHLQLTRKVVTNSDGKSLLSYTSYADDYPAGVPALDDMRANHLTGLPVENVSMQAMAGDTSIIGGKVVDFKPGGRGLLNRVYGLETAVPVPLAAFKFSNTRLGQVPNKGLRSAYQLDNRFVARLQYDNYTTTGDPLTIRPIHGTPTAYQWGYSSQYPVAQAHNTTSNNIFYESFEEGAGNGVVNDSKTGHYSYQGTYQHALRGLDDGRYFLTYWQKTNAQWKQQATVVQVIGGQYTINLTGQLDEMRFYPASSQLTTYTYDPLVGITSQTDPCGRIITYEYDGFQRLIRTRDVRAAFFPSSSITTSVSSA